MGKKLKNYSKLKFIPKDHIGNLRPVINTKTQILPIVKNILKYEKTQYSVNKYEAIRLNNGRIHRNHNYYTHNSEKFLNFSEYSDILTKKLESVLDQLKEHIKQNIIKVSNEYYRQKIGILQGSILSSILCSFSYGNMNLILPKMMKMVYFRLFNSIFNKTKKKFRKKINFIFEL
uniref:Telomerase reverse transcriptase n=1 Tax=Rhizophagus irregularis (strain DAOM 181602 / DAOM 197198 / MUCL 43194) TaxID=747089 RepID=U9TXC1_RHIID